MRSSSEPLTLIHEPFFRAAMREREDLERQLESLQGAKDAEARVSNEAHDLKDELARRQREIEKLAEEKSR